MNPSRPPVSPAFVSDVRVPWKAVFLILAVQLVWLITPALAFHFFGFQHERYRSNAFVYPEVKQVEWPLAYQTWDTSHFLFLADRGYVPLGAPGSRVVRGQTMFPLYAYSLRLIRLVFGSPAVLPGGLLLSNLFSFFACCYLFKLAAAGYGETTALRALGYGLVFPTAFYAGRVYSESLFLLLAVVFFWCLYKRNLAGASALSFLMPFTRLVGVFVAVPLFVFLAEQASQHGKRWYRPTRLWLALLCPLLGFGCTFLHMKWATGSWFEYLDAYKLFLADNDISNLLHPVRWFLDNFVYINLTSYGYTDNLFDRLAFVAYLFLLKDIGKRQGKVYFAYALVFGMVPALSDHFMSYSRYLFVIFPLFIQMALNDFRHRIMYGVLFTGQLVLHAAHSLGYWVG